MKYPRPTKTKASFGDKCCECGKEFRNGETVLKIWNINGIEIGKKHYSSLICEKYQLNDRQDMTSQLRRGEG